MTSTDFIKIEVVRQEAQKIEDIAGQINTILSQVATNVSSELSRSWRGTAASNFLKAWDDVTGAFDSYSNYVRDGLAAKAKNTAAQFSAAENV